MSFGSVYPVWLAPTVSKCILRVENGPTKTGSTKSCQKTSIDRIFVPVSGSDIESTLGFLAVDFCYFPFELCTCFQFLGLGISDDDCSNYEISISFCARGNGKTQHRALRDNLINDKNFIKFRDDDKIKFELKKCFVDS